MSEGDPPVCPKCDVEGQESPVGWACPECDRWLATLDSRGDGGG